MQNKNSDFDTNVFSHSDKHKPGGILLGTKLHSLKDTGLILFTSERPKSVNLKKQHFLF